MKKSAETYVTRQEEYQEQFEEYSRKFVLTGILRLLVFVSICFLIYKSFTAFSGVSIALLVIAVIAFVLLFKLQSHLIFKKKFFAALVEINKKEHSYVEDRVLDFEDGEEFVDTTHAFSYDLDFFGKNSLFQHLNRTSTYIGKKNLSELLQSVLSVDEIKRNQESIKELSSKIDFRQRINAFGNLIFDNSETANRLISWLRISRKKESVLMTILSWLFPAIFIVSVLGCVFSDASIFGTIATVMFFLNLSVMGSKGKELKSSLEASSKIDKILRSYSRIIEVIENEKFESEKLKDFQKKLHGKGVSASTEIKKLSQLFSQIDQIQNIVVLPFLNGTILYHVHVLRFLNSWVERNKSEVEDWLAVMSEIESLSSLANFAFNNEDFVFPEINEKKKIDFKNMGHPLISDEARVCNNVEFLNEKFIILTGSNMSGKSTFLRTLGVNMVLAGIGAPVCASQANVFIANVFVSMRLSDSLEDSESYFFAEVRRLKEIMENSESGKAFVLLDEILRGTNSDDKRHGTIEVIKKLISKDVVGAVATHDLEVCLTTQEYPNKLVNKCFEVEIVNDDLVFDYKLRDGVCKNKSATFLMKKMNVI